MFLFFPQKNLTTYRTKNYQGLTNFPFDSTYLQAASPAGGCPLWRRPWDGQTESVQSSARWCSVEEAAWEGSHRSVLCCRTACRWCSLPGVSGPGSEASWYGLVHSDPWHLEKKGYYIYSQSPLMRHVHSESIILVVSGDINDTCTWNEPSDNSINLAWTLT